MTHPRTVGGRVLLGPVSIPEPGTWYRTDASDGARRVFACLPPDDGGGPDLGLARERLEHLDHPAVPTPIELDDETGALLVAAPEGVPLARLLEHRSDEAFRISPATLLDFGTRLAELVVHAHERGRPHGHLSPECIWLTPDGGLVVWGFGSGPDALPPARWWSPERARGRRASGDADQWALGAILAALVTGRVPWRGDDPVGEARVGDATHLSQPVMEQWKPLGRIVERALAAEPRDRFPSVHPVRQALDAMRARVGRPSDLPAIAAVLAERFGDAPPLASAAPPEIAPEDVPEPPRLLMPPPAAASAGIAVEPRPLPPEPVPEPALAPLDAQLSDELVEHDLPTDLGTSPTQVPLDDGEGPQTFVSNPTVVPMDGQPSVVEEPPPLVLPEPSAASRHDPSALLSPADAAPLWYERFPIRRWAPWAVGALGVILLLYLGLLVA